ncbi:unnamed protein product [Ascophyllum nodosum]
MEKAEERVRTETARLESAVAGRLGERAEREEKVRREEGITSEEVVQLQNTLRDKEQRLARTVVDYLELRHAVLRAQRVSSEARDEAAAVRMEQEEQVRKENHILYTWYIFILRSLGAYR